jgi:membrane protease YdiL (CAAX protease family)
MESYVQFIGATLLTLALVDIGRRWGGAYPSPLSPATDRRREGLEIVVLYVLALGTVTYGILVARDVIAFNPAIRFLGRRFPLYFFLSTATMVVIPISLEVGVRDRSLRDLGIRSPVAWRPTLLLVGMGILLGLAPIAFGLPSPESVVPLLLALYSPVFTEEILYRGVIQSKLERLVSQERAWVFSGILFGLSHIPNDFFGPFWVASGSDPLVATFRLTAQTATGFLLGLLYMKSRMLAAPILGHYLSNNLATVISTILQ